MEVRLATEMGWGDPREEPLTLREFVGLIAKKLNSYKVHKYPKGEYHEPVRVVNFDLNGFPQGVDVEFRYRNDYKIEVEQSVYSDDRYRDRYVIYVPFYVERKENGAYVARKI